MNSQIERWARNKIADGWSQSIANTPIKDHGISIRGDRGKGEFYAPAFIEQIEKSYQALSQKEKDVIQSEYFESGDQRQKSENLGISHQCFRDRLYKARKKLRITDQSH